MAGRQGRPVPRDPALGQPPRQGEDGRAEVSGHRQGQRRPAQQSRRGALVRLIAGEVGEFTGPGSTRTPITLLHASLSPGSQLTLPWRKDFNALAYVLSGRGTAGGDRQPIESGRLAVFDGFGNLPGLGTDGETITLSAAGTQESRSPNMEVIVLGGRPIGEPVAHYGPFVMNTQAELAKAFEDYQAGRLGTIPAGHA